MPKKLSPPRRFVAPRAPALRPRGPEDVVPHGLYGGDPYGDGGHVRGRVPDGLRRRAFPLALAASVGLSALLLWTGRERLGLTSPSDTTFGGWAGPTAAQPSSPAPPPAVAARPVFPAPADTFAGPDDAPTALPATPGSADEPDDVGDEAPARPAPEVRPRTVRPAPAPTRTAPPSAERSSRSPREATARATPPSTSPVRETPPASREAPPPATRPAPPAVTTMAATPSGRGTVRVMARLRDPATGRILGPPEEIYRASFAAGRRTFTVRHPTYGSRILTVDVPPGVESTALVTFEAARPAEPARPTPPPATRADTPAARRAPAGPATLRLLVRPRGTVYVDGAVVARDAVSAHASGLAPGAHTVRVVHPTLGTWSREVTLRAGEDRRLVADLGGAP